MPKDKKKNYYLSYGVGFGLIGGTFLAIFLGLFLDTPLVWAFGPGLGMLAAIMIGIIMDSNENKE